MPEILILLTEVMSLRFQWWNTVATSAMRIFSSTVHNLHGRNPRIAPLKARQPDTGAIDHSQCRTIQVCQFLVVDFQSCGEYREMKNGDTKWGQGKPGDKVALGPIRSGVCCFVDACSTGGHYGYPRGKYLLHINCMQEKLNIEVPPSYPHDVCPTTRQ